MNRYKYGEFDPRSWPVQKDEDVCYISLSNRIDCTAIVNKIDYEWAKYYLWCHTYGSGSYNPETWIIERPDSIYARRSVPIEGFTPSGRPRYGNEFLHVEIMKRIQPRPIWGDVCDHLDGNTLNNKRLNLRWATKIMNNQNRRGSKYRKELLESLNQLDKPIYTCHNRIEIVKVGL